MFDPFAPEVFVLRVPIRKGEVEFTELTLRPPKLKDLLRTDGHAPGSVAYALALLSSLSGVPETVLQELVPEDTADVFVALARTNMRYTGQINLLDKKDGEKEPDDTDDPTDAAARTPPHSSEMTCAA